MAPVSDDLRAAFDPDAFRAQGHRTIDMLADYLAKAIARDAMPVLPWISPAEAVASWPCDFAEAHGEGVDAMLARIVRESNHLHHPRYIGHQVTSPLPITAICELVAALLNNGAAVYEMGPVSTAIERSLVRWLGAQLGYGSGCDGIFTSGGSAGNLTALLAARQARAGFDTWGEGAHGGPPLAILASEQTHYCVKRSAQIMGLGGAGVFAVPVDAQFRMRADALAGAHAKAERAGRRVIAVVASAGSTATGAFDPLDAIADYCAKRDLWFHVDGAHGASIALSAQHRPKLAGIERADSVVWDLHKMMLMPALVTAVLFREGARSYEAFSQEASYLFEGKAPEEEWFNGAVRTLECTKRMMSVKVYVALAAYGAKLFGDYIDATLDLAKRFAALLRASGDFEVATEPDCNIVCFRYVGGAAANDEERDGVQRKIRERLVARGGFYVVQTALNGRGYLRVTVINPMTEGGDLVGLMGEVREVAGDGM